MQFKNMLIPGKVGSKRIFYLDFLKAFAIFLVAVSHVSSQTLLYAPIDINWLIANFYSVFAKISIPIFIMISGVLMLNRNYNFTDFVGKRFPRILIPFIFWGAIYVIFSFAFGFVEGKVPDYSSPLSILSFIGFMFLGQAGYLTHFWFVWMILSVYLITPIINKWIKNSSFNEIEYFLIIWLITCAFTTFKLPYINIDLRYFAGPLGYFVLGYYLHNANGKIWSNKFLWPIVFVVFTIIRLCLPSGSVLTAGPTNSTLYYNILVVFQSVGFFLTIKNLSFNSKTFTNKRNFFTTGFTSYAIISLSSNVYGIYLGHLLFYQLLTPLYVINNYWLMIPLSGIFILALTWAMMLVFNEIPILRALTGRIMYKYTK